MVSGAYQKWLRVSEFNLRLPLYFLHCKAPLPGVPAPSSESRWGQQEARKNPSSAELSLRVEGLGGSTLVLWCFRGSELQKRRKC